MFQKLLSFAFLSLAVSANPLGAVSPLSEAEQELENQRLYIQEYQYLALRESNETKIPAAIIMAQAILESASGKSPIAQMANNHFGIKCKKGDNINGNCLYYASPEQFSNGYAKINSHFRRYATVEDSYRDHSVVLLANNYAGVRGLPLQDYKNWAQEIQKGGYATDKAYSAKLINLIETHQLYKLDEKKNISISPQNQKDLQLKAQDEAMKIVADNQSRLSECEYKYQTQAAEINTLRHDIELLKATIHHLETVIATIQEDVYKLDYQINQDPFKNKYDEYGNPVANTQLQFFPVKNLDARGTIDVNGRLATLVQKGENLLTIAHRQQKMLSDLLLYNDMSEAEAQNLPTGYYIFLEPKADFYESAEGAAAYHEVSQGQTLLMIAQRYGLKINKLYQNNLLKKGEEPAPNERIYLNKKRSFKPATLKPIQAANNSQFGSGGR